MPGKPIGDNWPSLSFAVRSHLVREVAISSACIFRKQVQGIGNIYGGSSVVEYSTLTKQSLPLTELVDTEITAPGKEKDFGLDDCSAPTGEEVEAPYFNLSNNVSEAASHSNVPANRFSEGDSPEIGRIVSMQFFWGPNIHHDIHRGPFRSSKDWIAARLMLNEDDCQATLGKYSVEDLDSDAEEEVDDATTTLQIINDLKSIFPVVFPTDDNDLEPLGVRFNITFMGSLYLPFVLDQRPRYSEPDVANYDREANGELNELYFAHLWEYEGTLLRDVFIDEMKNLDAEWMEIFDRSQVSRDLDFAVYHCNSGIYTKINAWIGDIAAGISNGAVCAIGSMHRMVSRQRQWNNDCGLSS
ncbi:hypothetical protein PENCOP_c009G07001 [Penicillium coprophilum]|uniref:Uncharacterized protein n=1 Tax=Penicillium coprophilum TaxID=36646 RepID=A0A1V6UHL4_9EURO|nr:hypothetical protein PENCOP_c009G07001 [Penicillium coprophilum]